MKKIMNKQRKPQRESAYKRLNKCCQYINLERMKWLQMKGRSLSIVEPSNPMVQIDLHQQLRLMSVYRIRVQRNLNYIHLYPLRFTLIILVTIVLLKCCTRSSRLQVDKFPLTFHELDQFKWVEWVPFHLLTSMRYSVRIGHGFWSATSDSWSLD